MTDRNFCVTDRHLLKKFKWSIVPLSQVEQKFCFALSGFLFMHKSCHLEQKITSYVFLQLFWFVSCLQIIWSIKCLSVTQMKMKYISCSCTLYCLKMTNYKFLQSYNSPASHIIILNIYTTTCAKESKKWVQKCLLVKKCLPIWANETSVLIHSSFTSGSPDTNQWVFTSATATTLILAITLIL